MQPGQESAPALRITAARVDDRANLPRDRRTESQGPDGRKLVVAHRRLPTRLQRWSLLGGAEVVLAAVLCAQPHALHAQGDTQENTSSATTYDSTGTVTAISAPLTITVSSKRGPFTYQLGPDLHVFGTDNKSWKLAQVTKGQVVTVYYYKRLGLATVDRLVVLQLAPARK